MRAAGYLRGESIATLDALGDWLFTHRITGRVYPLMREIVHAHQRRGHTVVLSSSALTIHAEPVARYLDIPHVLCNHFELDEHGLLTGGVRTPSSGEHRKPLPSNSSAQSRTSRCRTAISTPTATRTRR